MMWRKGNPPTLLVGMQIAAFLENYTVSSVAQSCPTLCDTMDCSIPGFPVYHQPPELAQTHVH